MISTVTQGFNCLITNQPVTNKGYSPFHKKRYLPYIESAYLVLVFIFQERLGENVNEFSEMFKMLGHFGGQHHVDDTLPDNFVAFSIQS